MEIENILKKLPIENLPKQVLKRMVFEHILMFEIDSKNMHRISNLLDISVKEQLAIEQKSKKIRK